MATKQTKRQLERENDELRRRVKGLEAVVEVLKALVPVHPVIPIPSQPTFPAPPWPVDGGVCALPPHGGFCTCPQCQGPTFFAGATLTSNGVGAVPNGACAGNVLVAGTQTWVGETSAWQPAGAGPVMPRGGGRFGSAS